MKSFFKQKVSDHLKRFFLSPTAKAFVDAITSTKTQIGLLLVCIFFAFICYTLATEKFAPEVHKITISASPGRDARYIDIQAVLNSSVIKEGYGVNQFLNLEVPGISKGEPALINDRLKTTDDGGNLYFSSVYAAFSGRDVYNPDYSDTLWHTDTHDPGVKRRHKEVDASTFVIEQQSHDGVAHESVMYYGNDIFYKSKSRNPYIAFYLKLNGFRMEEGEDPNYGISFYYTISDKEHSRDFEADNMEYKHPINLLNSYPQPSSISPTGLTYVGDEFKKILEDGLYFIAEDLSVKKQRDRDSFWYSLLLGALLSWSIQLVVSIVSGWKRAFSKNEIR